MPVDQDRRPALIVPCPRDDRWVTTGLNEPFHREQLRMVQTPQVFPVPVIRRAYELAREEEFTDDATVVESMGEKIHLIPGDPVNIKITYPADLVLAEALLKKPR